jgi:hypothetical protein
MSVRYPVPQQSRPRTGLPGTWNTSLTTAAGVDGTSATTNANDTSTASGTTTVVGTLARTNANDTSSASGTTTVVGTLAKTNANDASAAAGTTTVVAASASTNANDTANASGAVPANGSAAITNANDAASAEGATPRVNSGIPPRFKPVIWVHLKSEDEEVTVAEEDAAEAAEKLARKAVKRITRSTQTPAITVEGPVSRETKREIRSAFRAEFNRDAGVVAAKALIRAQQEQEDEETLLWLI